MNFRRGPCAGPISHAAGGPRDRTGGPGSRLLLGMLVLVAGARAAPDVLAPVTVSASRTEQSPEDLPQSADLISADTLRAAPAVTLDDALRSDVAFSLFRRGTSLSANPTGQGVSLRGLGPSGASRSLVLDDGIPLNDPFGGWVTWSALPTLSLERIEIVPGGASAAWGSAALSGVVALKNSPLAGERDRASADAGAFGTLRGEAEVVAPAGAGFAQLDFGVFSTEGYDAVAPNVRGAVDRPLDSAHQFVDGVWQQSLNPELQATVTGRLFSENRGNGTVLQRNGTRQAFASAGLAGTPNRDWEWTAVAYFERESFSSFFSTLASDRNTETPANDQYAVPAIAAGASATATWKAGPGATFSVGADARWVTGETRELFQFSGGAFTRTRFAGGAQDFEGIFAHHDRALGRAWRVSIGARVDRWGNRDGHDREYRTDTGAPTLLASVPARSGWELSPALGLVWHADSAWRLRANASRAFRLPTLNEYYRPYRVGSVTTLANPNLAVETVDGAEVGAEFTRGPALLTVSAFVNELDHAVGNVTIAQGAAATTVQRQNLDALRERGIEITGTWAFTPALSLRVECLFNDARVLRASEQPNLVGLSLAEVPRYNFAASFDGSAPLGIKAAIRLRWIGRQFDDDQNRLPLAAAATLDLKISRRFGRHVTAYAAWENAGNTAVETSSSAAGVFTHDAPRQWRAGASVQW